MATNHLTYSVITNRGVEVRARWVGTIELAVFDRDVRHFQVEWTHNLDEAVDRFNQLVEQNTYTVRPLTLPEALKIVSDNAHGVKHNYWDEYLPAVNMVNEAFPIVGYVTADDEWGDSRWSYGAMIERDNERVYSTKEQYR